MNGNPKDERWLAGVEANLEESLEASDPRVSISLSAYKRFLRAIEAFDAAESEAKTYKRCRAYWRFISFAFIAMAAWLAISIHATLYGAVYFMAAAILCGAGFARCEALLKQL